MVTAERKGDERTEVSMGNMRAGMTGAGRWMGKEDTVSWSFGASVSRKYVPSRCAIQKVSSAVVPIGHLAPICSVFKWRSSHFG